jgi:hypothetical protein
MTMENIVASVVEYVDLYPEAVWIALGAVMIGLVVAVIACRTPSDKEILIEVRCKSVEALNACKDDNGNRINSWFSKDN